MMRMMIMNMIQETPLVIQKAEIETLNTKLLLGFTYCFHTTKKVW